MEVQNVKIQLNSSIQHPGQDKETHELCIPGQRIRKADRTYLKYEENQSGEEVQTTVKMGEKDALIMRSGAVDMRLPFHLQAQRQGSYGNGPASFELIVKTESLEFTENDSGGQFGVIYELLAEGSVLGKYELTITYSEGTV